MNDRPSIMTTIETSALHRTLSGIKAGLAELAAAGVRDDSWQIGASTNDYGWLFLKATRTRVTGRKRRG